MTALEAATWSLDVATFLLVVAGAIPATQVFVERRDRKRQLASKVIPNMHFLKGRMEGQSKEVIKAHLSRQDLTICLNEVNEQLGILRELMETAEGTDMKLVGELLVSQHLLSQARIMEWHAELNWGAAVDEPDQEGGEWLQRAATLFVAAKLSLDAAERALPEWARGTKAPFYEQFKQVAAAREERARQMLGEGRDGRT